MGERLFEVDEPQRDDVERNNRRASEIAKRRRVDAPVDDATGSTIERPPPIQWVAPKPLTYDEATMLEWREQADRLEVPVYCGLLPGCGRNAEGWFDGTPCCCDCVDAWLERDAALRENPYLQLPDLEAPH